MGFFSNLFGGKQNDASEAKNKSNAETLKFDAIRALRAGDVDFALKALRHAIHLHDSFEVRYHYIDALIAADKKSDALLEVENLIPQAPENPLLYKVRAELLLSLKQGIEQVLADAEQIVKLTTEQDAALYFRAWYLKTRALFMLERYEEALEAVAQVLANDAQMLEARLLKVDILNHLQRWDEVQRVVEEGKKDFPENENFDLFEADMFIARGDLDAADRAYHRALELNPFSMDAVIGLASNEVRNGHAPEAAERLEQALDEIGRHRPLLEMLKKIYAESGSQDKVAEIEKELSELEDDMHEVNFSSLYSGMLY